MLYTAHYQPIIHDQLNSQQITTIVESLTKCTMSGGVPRFHSARAHSTACSNAMETLWLLRQLLNVR